MTALDVGQGDAIYLRDGSLGVLVDTGMPGSRAAEKAGGPVDLLVLTHLERDHAGDVVAVLRAARPAAVIWNGRTDAPLYEELREAANAADVPIVAVAVGDAVRFGATTLRVLAPNLGYRTSADHNDSSLVLRADFPDFSGLLTGDAPAEVEETLSGVDVDVLKLGHHGSKTSTSDLLLDAATPELAVASLGRENRYGHPAPAVLDRLAARDVPLLRTDQQGSVTVFARNGALRVTTSSVR